MKLYLPGTDLWSWCRGEQAAWPEDEDDVLVSIIVQQLCDGVGTARMPASAQKRRFGCSLGSRSHVPVSHRSRARMYNYVSA